MDHLPLQGAALRRSLTFVLVAGLLAAFVYATYLSYYAGVDIRSAFAYQEAVVAAQRDSELLAIEQFDRRVGNEALRPYEKLLASDLQRIAETAEVAAERPPEFRFPAKRSDYDRLTERLRLDEDLGRRRFDLSVTHNGETRNLSNTLFALAALLFALVAALLRSRIERGRELVEGLQRAFVSRRHAIPNLDVGSVLISATRGSDVGGDLHDTYPLDERHAMLLVADVSGKGIAAAVDTAFIKYSLRTLSHENFDPGIVLTKFARLYASMAENPESFVVLFLAVIDSRTGTVRYASAGHEAAFVKVGQDVAQLETTGTIVGIEATGAYAARTVHLSRGDALVIATDGLTESRDARRRLLGSDNVRIWLSQIDGGAQSIADSIVRRLRKRSKRITDDLAILVVRYDALAPTAPKREPAVPPERVSV